MSSKSGILSVTASLLTTTVVAMSASSAIAQTKNYAGLSLSSWNGTTAFGVTSKFGVAENISVRPFIQFASESASGVTATYALYGASATYDFKMPTSGFTPYVGLGFLAATVSVNSSSFSGSASSGSSTYLEGGADYAISDSIVLNANYRSNSNAGGYFSVGAGYQF